MCFVSSKVKKNYTIILFKTSRGLEMPKDWIKCEFMLLYLLFDTFIFLGGILNVIKKPRCEIYFCYLSLLYY